MSYFLGKNLKIYSKRIALAILLAVFVTPAVLFIVPQAAPTTNAQSPALNLSVSPTSPVPPGTTLNISWSVSGQDTFIGGGCKVSPPVGDSDPAIRLAAQSCGNNLGVGGRTNGAVTTQIDATSQIIFYTSGYTVVKAVLVEVSAEAPTPTPGEFKVTQAVVNPNPVTAGKIDKLDLGWTFENGPATFIVTYTTKNEKGEVLKGPDNQPLENLTLEIPSGACSNASCTVDIRRFAAVGPEGLSCQGITIFTIEGTGTRNKSATTAQLTVNKSLNAPDQGDTTGGVCNQTIPDNSLTGSLFSFLRQVIAYIVLVLTGIIYYIFSSILVPVIVALLGIHPYKDSFVNFIYPGWLILRNISNIFFIIALLWIGLRTIFQMEDAAKSRTFILRLILAALLVNFSLVIGQAIVGIADTVQSQFLPADSKVVETLGFKLMVDPIITFRGTEGGGQDNYGLTEGGNFTTQGLASDLPKAVILLILAISAFFAFVALIAFLIVRVVALWLLYMISPIAYVGRILPQTEQAANKWWAEFIKYAFAVPIMAFFLNIAALLAVNLSRPTGQTVQTGNSNTTILGGLISTGTIASEFVSFATTVLSHFLVLVFMYGGMMFALKFGGAGSKKIVEYAKKGFDAVTRKAPLYAGKWAKDTGADFMAQREFAQKRPGLQTLFRSTARPIEALKAVKKGYLDEPRKAMEKRFTDKFDDVSSKWQPWGEDKLLPAKMLGWKLAGKNAPALLAQAKRLQDQRSIMDDEERDKKLEQLQTATTDKARNQEIIERMADGKLGLYAANNELARLDNLHEDAEQKMLAEKDPLKKKQLRDRSDELKERKEALGVAIAAATAAGSAEINLADVSSFNKDELTEVLQKQIDDADSLTTQIKPELDKDTELRNRYGIDKMNPEIRKDLDKQIAKLTKDAQEREWPYSKSVEKAEAAAVKEEQKGLVDLDYEQLEDVYLSALKKNNVVQAKAAVKQMAENGQVSKLLEAKGLKNNVEDLAKLVAQDFKGTQRSQVQIIREISNTSAKNGNNSLAYAVTSIQGGGGIVNSLQAQQVKLAEGKQKSIYESKADDLIYTDPSGQKRFNKGTFEKVIKPNDTETKIKEVQKKLDPKVAAKVWEVLDSQPELRQKLSSKFIKAIDEVRLKG